MLAKVVGHFQFCSLQNTEKLQGVDDRLALVVVVGDDEGVAGVLLDFLNARDPGVEFLSRIEIVVTLVGGKLGIIAEPGVVAAAVETHVANGRGALRGWREGIADDGLIDVAEASVVLMEKIESGVRLPGGMTEFDDKRVVGEAFEKSGKMSDGFGRFVEGKTELEKNSAQLARFTENVKAGADVAFVFGGGRWFVREALPEFGGEQERRICGNAFEPACGVFRADGLIEGSVNFDGVEKLGEEGRLVKSF